MNVIEEQYELYQGDCLEVIKRLSLPKNTAVITDPPYGDEHDTDYTRFTNGVAAHRNWLIPITNDNQPFDPTPWLSYTATVLFGANRFSDKLPTGTWIVWDKRTPEGNKGVMSDAEVAWWNKGRGVYIFEHTWDGFNRASERNTSYHPTQKPVALFKWMLTKMCPPKETTILDPYMGSGPLGIAAVQMGYRYIGIEISPDYFQTAADRIADAARAAAKLPKQLRGNASDIEGLPLLAL